MIAIFCLIMLSETSKSSQMPEKNKIIYIRLLLFVKKFVPLHRHSEN